MKRYKRVFLIIIDSLGVGAMPDAAHYGDEGADTLGHIWAQRKKLDIPNLRTLGLGQLVGKQETGIGYYTRLHERSAGKDTMSGHWEMMGLPIEEPFLTFQEHGFPKALIEELERVCQREFVGNKAASGTDIIDEYAHEELENGKLIIYTSADSVLQICAHEVHTGLKTLYDCCEKARELTLQPQWKVGRVIARPYIGEHKGAFQRTANRHDYALKPFRKTALTYLQEAGHDVIGIGKIYDIFAGEGVSEQQRSQSSVHGMQQTIAMLTRDFTGLCFTNLVDFDALWGHRRNPQGYGEELEKFDTLLGNFIQGMQEDDLLLISGDHGNDPTFKGSDHTREMVPLLCYSKGMKQYGRLPDYDTFATIGATIADNFMVSLPDDLIGTSILHLIK